MPPRPDRRRRGRGPQEERQMTDPGAPDEVRASLAVALDVDDAVAALRLAPEPRPWGGVAQGGPEHYRAAGPDVVGFLQAPGSPVFSHLNFPPPPHTLPQ